MSGRFEGSFLGDASRIAPDAKLECKICWHVYDPEEGDEMRQIAPNTPFSQLPDDWHCPNCDGEKNQFMVIDEGAGLTPAQVAHDFKDVFSEIHKTKMQDMPFCNRSIHVETVGFQYYGARIIGVLVTPWCMNLIVTKGAKDNWDSLKIGDKRVINFPSGDYEFIFNTREGVGPYFACSLFSPMEEFNSHLQAIETARAIMGELFNKDNIEANDKADEIKELREKELAPPESIEAEETIAETKEPPPALSRRALFTGSGNV